jgi:aryl-alcohol dehydrogenase-like predicted oxidoreductase
MSRSFEREIIPMARHEGWLMISFICGLSLIHLLLSIGMALCPWNTLAGGKFRTDEEEESRRQSGEKGRTIWSADWERTEDEKKMSRALAKVADEVGTKHITAGR